MINPANQNQESAEWAKRAAARLNVGRVEGRRIFWETE